ncbi:Prenylated Rab acceptor protein 1 [Tilletia horrida]|nr:Prenylated Rab acceptor protein 1 [Tilletia horrida]
MIAFTLFLASLAGSALTAALPPSSVFTNPAEALIARATGDNQGGGNGNTQWIKDIPIHESCNNSQRLQIERGFKELYTVSQAAADDIYRHGNTSELFKTYFGSEADPAVPIGIYERIINGDKTGTLFRCDDPDRNCETQPTYFGHWRGSNATGETVICENTFQGRKSIEAACGFGFQLARDNVNTFLGLDFLHRLLHLPTITNELVNHVADNYTDVLELARTNATFSVRNQHSIQNFAFEVWTRANIDPNGCVGEPAPESEDDDDTSGQATPSASATTSAPTTTSTGVSGQDCHSHADGSIHCV